MSDRATEPDSGPTRSEVFRLRDEVEKLAAENARLRSYIEGLAIGLEKVFPDVTARMFRDLQALQEGGKQKLADHSEECKEANFAGSCICGFAEQGGE